MSKKFSNFDDEMLIDQVREFPSLYDHENKDFKDFQIRENIWSQIGKVSMKSSEECKARWKHIRDNYLKHKRKQKLGTGSAASTRPPKWPLFQHLKFLELVKSERSRIQNASQEGSQNEYSQDSPSLAEDRRTQNEGFQNSRDLEDDAVSDSDSKNSTDIIDSQPKTPQFTNINPKRIKLTSECSNYSAPRTQSAKVKLLQHLEEHSNQRTKMLSQLINKKEEDDEIDLFMRSIALTVKKLPPHKVTQAKIQILSVVSNLQMPSVSTESSNTMPSQPSLPSTSFIQESLPILNLEEPTTASGPLYTITTPYSLCKTNLQTL